MIKNVCIFASSCNYIEQSYYDAAAELGALLGDAGMNLIYGGSCLGLMWACAENVKKRGGSITGVMPIRLYEMDVSSHYCDEFFLMPCMRTRKAKMDELSDALVALPGGFGTLEELSEMIVQKQLGYNQKAIVILNTNGFYDKLLNFFDEIIAQKFANKKAAHLFFVAKTPQQAVEYLKNYSPYDSAVKKDDIYAR